MFLDAILIFTFALPPSSFACRKAGKYILNLVSTTSVLQIDSFSSEEQNKKAFFTKGEKRTLFLFSGTKLRLLAQTSSFFLSLI